MGYYAYKRMPFGLKGAPAAFCELISTAFAPVLGKTVEAWMDDLATSSDNFDDHLAAIRMILETCQKHRLSLNPAKCELFTSGMVRCRNYLSKKGRQPDAAEVHAVIEWKEPSNAVEVLQFVNFAGHYRALIKDFARLTEPLSSITKGVTYPRHQKGRNGGISKGAYKAALYATKVKWTDDLCNSFVAVKSALTSFPVLRSPNYSLPFKVETDASLRGFGAILSQDFMYLHPETGKTNTKNHPVAYASRATKVAEKRYSAFLLELVCVKWAFEKFQKYIFGRPLHLITDCEAIAGTLSKQSVSAAHTRWREYIISHNIVRFTHRPGEKTVAADLLSRRTDNPEEDDPTTPDVTIPETWSEYNELQEEKRVRDEERMEKKKDEPSTAAPRRQPKECVTKEKEEELFEATFLAECFRIENQLSSDAPKERMRNEEQFEDITSLISSLQMPADITSAEAGHLRAKAKDFFIADDGTLRKRDDPSLEGGECILARERTKLIDAAHEQMNHAGRDRVLAHLHHRFFWAGMRELVYDCQGCGRKIGTLTLRGGVVEKNTGENANKYVGVFYCTNCVALPPGARAGCRSISSGRTGK